MALERACVVVNPAAHNAPSRERLFVAASALIEHGWEIEIRESQKSGDATALARTAAASGAKVVFACGGDGTINEVVNGIVGSEASLGVIAAGMGNVFAKEIGVPRSPEAALRVLLEGETHRFDLGVAGGRYFLLMCGIGFDAEVVREVPSALKRILGSTSHLLQAIRELPTYQPHRVRLRLEGAEQEVDLTWMLLGNTRSYGGVINITSEALADDGLLDVYVYTGRGLPWTVTTGLRLATGRIDGARGVTFHRLRELEVPTPGVPVQADGEYFGDTPMSFSVAPRALSVLMLRGRGLQLLSRLE